MSEDLSALGLVELLDKLIQPTPPPDISMAPATAGWIWLSVVTLIILGIVTSKLISRHRANAYRRSALSLLGQTSDDPIAIATLLRETALAAFPRNEVASLIGEDWLAFLDEAADKNLFVNSDSGKALIQSPYRNTPSSPELTSHAREWITSHKVRSVKLKGAQ